MEMLVTKFSKGKYRNEGDLFAEPISNENVKLMGEMIALQALRTVKKFDMKVADRLYLQEAFIIKKALRYDVKRKRYINTPYKVYFEDTGLRNARLNFRQTEPTHLMENIIFNELRYRGYQVDVGVVENRTYEGGKDVKNQLEIDFIANQGSKRYYIQSAYDIPTEEKRLQETRSFDKVGDSFKKIIVIERNIKPRRDEKGYLTIGIRDFLLDGNSLDL